MTIAPEVETVATAYSQPSDRRGRFYAVKRLGTPVLVAVVLLVLYVWVHSQTLDSIEERTLNRQYLTTATWQHLKLTVVATVLIVVISIPAGVLLSRTRSKAVTASVLGLANIGQAAPAIGVLVLLTIKFGVGFRIALIGLVAYAVLPVLRNTLIGIQQVDANLVEAARGMGMTASQTLLRVELPMAVPVILAGLRTALVFCVGVATLATFVNAGGLGDIIVNGIKLNRTPVLVTGSVIVASIALLLDWLGGLVEERLRPSGT